MTPRRRTISAVLVGIGALVYGVSPIDIIPDFLGPLGLVDDAAVWVGAAVWIFNLIKGRGQGPGVTPPKA